MSDRSLLTSEPLWNGLLVLNYHRIRDPTTVLYDICQVSADQETFSAQVRALNQKCDLIHANEVETALLERRGRFVMITFDDGYRDNFEVAFPVLAAERTPATFFITTDFLDTQQLAWWDRIGWVIREAMPIEVAPTSWLPDGLHLTPETMAQVTYQLAAIYRGMPKEDQPQFLEHLLTVTGLETHGHPPVEPPWMTWDMVRALESAGMAIGGHSSSHPELSRLAPDDQAEEIRTCQDRLTQELGHPVRAFSYPHGGPASQNEITMAALRSSGFTHAFTHYGGFAATKRIDRLRIPRVPIGLGLTSNEFDALIALPQIFAMNRHVMGAGLRSSPIGRMLNSNRHRLKE